MANSASSCEFDTQSGCSVNFSRPYHYVTDEAVKETKNVSGFDFEFEPSYVSDSDQDQPLKPVSHHSDTHQEDDDSDDEIWGFNGHLSDYEYDLSGYVVGKKRRRNKVCDIDEQSEPSVGFEGFLGNFDTHQEDGDDDQTSGGEIGSFNGHYSDYEYDLSGYVVGKKRTRNNTKVCDFDEQSEPSVGFDGGLDKFDTHQGDCDDDDQNNDDEIWGFNGHYSDYSYDLSGYVVGKKRRCNNKVCESDDEQSEPSVGFDGVLGNDSQTNDDVIGSFNGHYSDYSYDLSGYVVGKKRRCNNKVCDIDDEQSEPSVGFDGRHNDNFEEVSSTIITYVDVDYANYYATHDYFEDDATSADLSHSFCDQVQSNLALSEEQSEEFGYISDSREIEGNRNCSDDTIKGVQDCEEEKLNLVFTLKRKPSAVRDFPMTGCANKSSFELKESACDFVEPSAKKSSLKKAAALQERSDRKV